MAFSRALRRSQVKSGARAHPTQGHHIQAACILAAGLLFVVVHAVAQSKCPLHPWGPPKKTASHQHPQFFPAETFPSTEDRLITWYTWYLCSMAERPLAEYLSPTYSQAYRLLVLPAHRPPFIVRLLVSTHETSRLVAKMGKSDLEPEILVIERPVTVSPQATERFLHRVDISEFWSMQTEERSTHRVVMGGVEWILEGADSGRYHVVVRKEPEPGDFSALLLLLARDLAELEVPVGSLRHPEEIHKKRRR